MDGVSFGADWATVFVVGIFAVTSPARTCWSRCAPASSGRRGRALHGAGDRDRAVLPHRLLAGGPGGPDLAVDRALLSAQADRRRLPHLHRLARNPSPRRCDARGRRGRATADERKHRATRRTLHQPHEPESDAVLPRAVHPGNRARDLQQPQSALRRHDHRDLADVVWLPRNGRGSRGRPSAAAGNVALDRTRRRRALHCPRRAGWYSRGPRVRSLPPPASPRLRPSHSRVPAAPLPSARPVRALALPAPLACR